MEIRQRANGIPLRQGSSGGGVSLWVTPMVLTKPSYPQT
ncbi:hypothetical protein [Vibrio phage JSF2]|nr:hypothetical protein [Vibrio phage JSF6]ASV41828.1 hypothetical protein [Vibrio phage JSF1]ASV41969.1 hypothetical protein [Vibrio phage JSF2]